jgi:hydroxymethylpyrimidine pyrophosphatase-like HAD family hydrolase
MSPAKLSSGSSPRLIAIDIDGTLLGETGQVSSRNLAALLAAHAAGIEVVVATGRRHAYAMRVLRPLELPHACALISSNGAVTRTLGSCSVGDQLPTELIARTHMSAETALWLCGHLGEYRDALVLTFDTVAAHGPNQGDDTRGALVVERFDGLYGSLARWMDANAAYIAQVDPIENALQPENPPIQAMLCGTPERMRAAEAHLLLDPRVVAVGHTPDTVESHHEIALHRTEYPGRDLSILDILPAGCSKGAALLALAASRNIHASEILAIGDNWNDVSMLEVAGSAVLMDNAPDDLKELARERGWHIGPSHRDDGVAVAIESALGVSATC